jgi:ribosomal protein S18 acetylase RimI-like enzyme
LTSIACASGLFEPHQLEELTAMLERFFAVTSPVQEIWVTDDEEGPVGVAYTAAERMTEGTWNLYLIAVHPEHQRKGRGKALLEYLEHTLAERGERMLLVETSGTLDFECVRRFYRNCGYETEARIRDFYARGVDKIVFRKLIETPVARDNGDSAP